MTRSYKILRALLMALVTLAVVIPMFLYVALSLPVFQRQLVTVAQRELSHLLGTRVDIGSLSIAPFNRILLRDIAISDDAVSDTLLKVDRLGAGINLYEFLRHGDIIINYAEIIGLDATISRDSLNSPINIQPIIDRLQSKDDRKSAPFSMAINTVLMRNCRLAYDVKNIPQPVPGVFSPHHVEIIDLSSDFLLPSVGNEGGRAIVKRLRIRERSGLEISSLSGTVEWLPGKAVWHNVDLTMPRSELIANRGQWSDTLRVEINTGSHIHPADLAPVVPVLSLFTEEVNLTSSVTGTLRDNLSVNLTTRTPSRSLEMTLKALVHSPLDTASREIREMKGAIDVLPSAFLPLLENASPLVKQIAEKLGKTSISLSGNGSLSHAKADALIVTTQGNIKVSGSIDDTRNHLLSYKASLDINDMRLGNLLGRSELDKLTMTAFSQGVINNKRPDGTLTLRIDNLDLNGHPLSQIAADLEANGNHFDFSMNSDDPAAKFDFLATGDLLSKNKELKIASHVSRVDLGELFPLSNLGERVASLNLKTDLSGTEIDNVDGMIDIRDIIIKATDGKDLVLNGISIDSSIGENGFRTITLNSDMIDGSVTGTITPSRLKDQLVTLFTTSVPALKKNNDSNRRNSGNATDPTVYNDFACQFTIHETEPWTDALRLPVSVLGDGHIHGAVNGDMGNFSLVIDLPYLRQGNKLIEKTRLQATIESEDSTSTLSFVTNFPTQHGPLALDFASKAVNDEIFSILNWNIDRAARYDGHLSATTRLERYAQDLFTTVNVHQGALTFNDSTWTINNAAVKISPDLISIDGLNAHRSGQFVKIDGRISPDPQDIVTVDLLGVNLDYIFESLGIDKVMLGGDATGCFYASNLMTKEPHLLTDRLFVRDISYNKVVLGDAVIKSRWDAENRAITLDAVVEQANGLNTTIDGAIFPLNDSIDITFDAKDVNVGFMYPYMSAFASEVTGRASGVARLWGNFKYIDMEGDIVGDNVGIKIAFTNTSYTTSDTIRLRLGEITLHNLEIKDMYGNRGVLDGKVWHKYFKEPVFDFTVKDVSNMLVYDENSHNNPDWYGKIFANGSARVDGRPGVVNIGVNMSTAPGSNFTFVLNNMEEASDYSFITFRNRDVLTLGEDEQLVDTVPSAVRRLKELLAHREEETASAYNIDLVMDINPNARIDLVMDPVGGDRIRSWGNGNLRMTYGSSDNELHMYGSYTLDKGNYNFTLQDIIIKNFTIKPGSSISFTGDPFAAMLDIKAIYALNANLSDLDESFLQDKDLNRTNVPVHAVLQVAGPLNMPDISFDLDFPTLTQDTYRKVRSIVSTDDMMNRQIIYLLALNRFYTPDYMSSTNRGSELMSVASSTISSQLGNILGSLSDKWNIAPNFRSEREDFSDVEVDVALSSSLLNNRLLFNGNFGYRDKSLNSTQFVGDFDIEYLLNRSGSFRLKAYNRYNDQNYYVRTADTTQGVGVSFRRNFDTFSDLLKSFHRKKKSAEK